MSGQTRFEVRVYTDSQRLSTSPPKLPLGDGSILVMSYVCNQTPPKKAMEWYFEHEMGHKRARGSKRATIVTTLQRDIRTACEHLRNFEIRSLANFDDLIHISNLARNRKKWRKITKAIVDAAKAKLSGHQD